MPDATLQNPVNPRRALTIDGKKFLWDGRLFENYEEAAREAQAYKDDNFEVQLVEEGGKHLVYTRRVVKEVVVSAPS
ncbi:MAG TPA: hypothetical protein VL240_01365 [Candidatus Binatia bacterium]|nr:hypothetical protein [Candidatus Binatia bacterium]